MPQNGFDDEKQTWFPKVVFTKNLLEPEMEASEWIGMIHFKSWDH